MANEANKDFNAMLREARDMPRIQIVTDEKTIAKYGGSRMFFAPPAQYDAIMKRVPFASSLLSRRFGTILPGKMARISRNRSRREFS